MRLFWRRFIGALANTNGQPDSDVSTDGLKGAALDRVHQDVWAMAMAMARDGTILVSLPPLGLSTLCRVPYGVQYRV